MLTELPPEMAAWNMSYELPDPNENGEYQLIECEQSSIELHHQVEALDEAGFPLRGVWVIFGFPGGGPAIDLRPKMNLWRGAPRVLRGNAQRTNGAGYAQHTFQSGGEDIWIWDIEDDDVLRLSSAIVRNCNWVGPARGGRFLHTGVKLVFQRNKTGVITIEDRLNALEKRIGQIEEKHAG